MIESLGFGNLNPLRTPDTKEQHLHQLDSLSGDTTIINHLIFHLNGCNKLYDGNNSIIVNIYLVGKSCAPSGRVLPYLTGSRVFKLMSLFHLYLLFKSKKRTWSLIIFFISKIETKVSLFLIETNENKSILILFTPPHPFKWLSPGNNIYWYIYTIYVGLKKN